MYAMGTGGDIDPMIKVGEEFKSRGHKVTFLSNDYFKQRTIETGLDFVPVGTLEQYHKGNSVDAWQIGNDTDNFEFYHAPAFEPAFNYIMSLENIPGTVVISLTEQNGAAVAAMQRKIPLIKFILSANSIFSAVSPPAPQCWTITKKLPTFVIRFLLRSFRKHNFMRIYDSPAAAEYLATRERLGCPVVFKKKSSAMLQLCFFPEWYGMRPKDWPTDIKLLGFHLANRPNINLRKEMDLLFERIGSPIVFTSGTGVKDVAEVFREGRKTCELLKVPGLFVGGDIGKDLLAGSELCTHISYIDFEYALPKAKVIIHHGGIGTMAQAIKAGIPQLIRPIKYDQPDNANRIAKLGIGAYVLPEFFTAETVAPILSKLIAEAPQNEALKKYSADVNGSNAIVEACNLIEQALNDDLNKINIRANKTRSH